MPLGRRFNRIVAAAWRLPCRAFRHYEIARYGTMIAWAKQLGMNETAALLQQTLDQEYGADRHLTSLAEGRLNREAA